MLRVDHVKIAALPALSFEVADGECFAIEGPSGSGKTRLLRAIADLDPATGQVFLDGVERGEMPAPRWRSLVRYVAAEPGWWTDGVGEALAVTPANEARIARLLMAVGLEASVIKKPVALLSTGERQRLSLVRALGGEPRALLFDEPTAALDVAASALVEELIRFQLLAGRAVLISSHDRALVGRLAHARLELAPPAAPANSAGPAQRVAP